MHTLFINQNIAIANTLPRCKGKPSTSSTDTPRSAKKKRDDKLPEELDLLTENDLGCILSQEENLDRDYENGKKKIGDPCQVAYAVKLVRSIDVH